MIEEWNQDEEDEYEELYNRFAKYDEEDGRGITDETYPLPDIIQEWIDIGSNYSKHNSFPLKMCYFNIMGQVLKDFIQIPQGSNRKDSRLHFIWLQTARTGKSAVWSYMSATLKGVYKEINLLKLTDDYLEFDEQIKDNDIFDISVYTSAALIGTFVENDTGSTKFDPEIDEGTQMVTIINEDAEESNPIPFNPNAEPAQIYNRKFINEKKRFIPGALKGSGIAHWDEFESSGIFNNKKHNEDMLLTFQTFMNDIDEVSEGHIMTKYLAGVAQVGKCNSERSLYATSYVPQNLASIIHNSGVLQRAFIYVREVPNHIRRDMYKYVVDSIGQDVDSTMEVKKFIEHFKKVHIETARRWKEVKCKCENKEKEIPKCEGHCKKASIRVITLGDGVNDVLHTYRRRMKEVTRNCTDSVITAVESFNVNFILYNIKIAMFIAVADGRYKISTDDAHCAGRIVQNAYNELVGWLEQGMTVQRQSLSNNLGLNSFKRAYYDSTNKDEEGYVFKRDYLSAVAKLIQLSDRQTERNYIKLIEKFDTIKKGREVYIKYIGE